MRRVNIESDNNVTEKQNRALNGKNNSWIIKRFLKLIFCALRGVINKKVE